MYIYIYIYIYVSVSASGFNSLHICIPLRALLRLILLRVTLQAALPRVSHREPRHRVPDAGPRGLGRLLPSADRRHRANRRVAGGLPPQPGASALGHPPAGRCIDIDLDAHGRPAPYRPHRYSIYRHRYIYKCAYVHMYMYIHIDTYHHALAADLRPGPAPSRCSRASPASSRTPRAC